MIFKSPTTDDEFQRYFAFRWQQLRAPWQQPRGSEQDELEEQSFHVMAVNDDDEIIGVGRLHFLSGKEAQVRYMAVNPACQGQGIGRAILQTLERYASAREIETIQLHARENALMFYQKAGYNRLEKSHLLYNEIQHYRMEKRLTPKRHTGGIAG